MTKWEYVTVPLLVHATKQILDNWGQDGWELVQVVPGLNPENLVAYLKRPLEAYKYLLGTVEQGRGSCGSARAPAAIIACKLASVRAFCRPYSLAGDSGASAGTRGRLPSNTLSVER